MTKPQKTESDALTAALETHRENMKKTQENDRRLGDCFLNGYHCGIQDGLEAAVNIVKNGGKLIEG
jgi:hypothetical protein